MAGGRAPIRRIALSARTIGAVPLPDTAISQRCFNAPPESPAGQGLREMRTLVARPNLQRPVGTVL